MASRLLAYASFKRNVRVQLKIQSLDVTLSPFENFTSWRSLKVQVLPSAEMSGRAVAPSGTMVRLLSNL